MLFRQVLESNVKEVVQDRTIAQRNNDEYTAELRDIAETTRKVGGWANDRISCNRVLFAFFSTGRLHAINIV